MNNNLKINRCIFCKEINDISQNIINPFFVLKLKTGYVSLGYNQYYKGYCLFISKVHASELHKLDNKFKKQFLIEMSLVGEVICKVFKPKKLNIELLGNTHSHLHWHLLPRYKNDILPKIPVWNNPNFLDDKTRPTKSELVFLKKKLLKGFDKIL
jgi:diadenosine tetraphosphate (Ap4A) HIT family hydrolase